MYHGVNVLSAGLPATAVATGVAASSGVAHAFEWGWIIVAALTLFAAFAAVARLVPRRRRTASGIDAYPPGVAVRSTAPVE